MIADRLLHIAALGLWAVAGLPVLGSVDGPWLAAWGAFAVAYALAQRPGASGRSQVGFLAVQSVTALTVVARGGGIAPEALLAVVAGQAPFLVSPRVALGWVAAQVGVMFVVQVPRGVGMAAAEAGLYGTFQLFAVGAAVLAVRERRAREDLAAAHAELLATRERLEEQTREAEPLRIARDLHDALGHHLTALSLQLELASHLATGAAVAPVAEARELARRLLGDVRQTVSALREEGPADLVAALDAAARVAQPTVHLDRPADLHLADARVATAVLRCVQEIVTNASRHARAANVWIRVARTPGGVSVAARDDGAGASAVAPGNGLAGMHERLHALGGTLEVHTAPGEGFRVLATLPERAP